MGGIINVARWEWFKLRSRWMPWVLLAVLLSVSQIFLWGSFFTFNTLSPTGGQVNFAPGDTRGVDKDTLVNCDLVLSGEISQLPVGPDTDRLIQQCTRKVEWEQGQLREAGANFTLPSSIEETLKSSHLFAIFLFVLISASVVGMDYRMGTLSMALSKGTGRWQYLAGKVLLLAMVAASALAILVLTTATSSLIASGLVSGWPPQIESGSWISAAVVLGKAWLSLLSYLALTVLFTVLTRSSAIGMALGVGYYLTEWTVVAITSSLFDWAGAIANYLLLQNMSALVGGLPAGFRGAGPSQFHALAVLIVYWLGFSAAAFWIFQRRDVTGPSGD